MYPPEEFYNPGDNIFWKLLKAIYGLRSSPKAWQKHLRSPSTNRTSPKHSRTQHLHDSSTQLLRSFLRRRPPLPWRGTDRQQALQGDPTAFATSSNRHIVSRKQSSISWQEHHQQRRPLWGWLSRWLRHNTSGRNKPTRQQASTSTRNISTEDSNSWSGTSTFNRRTRTVQKSSRKTTMDDLHQTWHQLCNKGSCKSTSTTNNSRPAEAETLFEAHQRNKGLQTNYATNSEVSSRGYSWPNSSQLWKQNAGNNCILRPLHNGRTECHQHWSSGSTSHQKSLDGTSQHQQGQHQDPHRLVKWQEHGHKNWIFEEGKTHWDQTSLRTTTDLTRLPETHQKPTQTITQQTYWPNMSQQRLCNDTFNKLDLASSNSTFTEEREQQFHHHQLATSRQQHQHFCSARAPKHTVSHTHTHT